MKNYEGLYLTEYKTDWNTNEPIIWNFQRLKNGEKKITKIKGFRPYFYVSEESTLGEKDKIYTSIFGDKVKKVFVNSPKEVYNLRKHVEEMGFKHYEADILYNNRFLIDEVEEIIPSDYKKFYIDIETLSEGGFPDVNKADQIIVCLTIYNSFTRKYLTWFWRADFDNEIIKTDIGEIRKFTKEKDMLQDVINYIKIELPDVMTGWNCIHFDFKYLLNRMKNIFELDVRDMSPMRTAYVTEDRPGLVDGKSFKGVPIIKGIVLFDLLNYYRKVHKGELSSYSLNNVAQEELGEEKTDSHHVIDRDYRNDWMNVVKYNIKDVELCVKIDEKTGVFDFFDQMRTIAHANIDDCKWYGRVVDTFILRYAKKNNIILPSKKPFIRKEDRPKLEGGHVMEPIIGLHQNIMVIDLNQIYPSLIETFNLSAETNVIDGEININDINFTKKFKGIIPSVIDELGKLRNMFKGKMKELRYNDPDFKIYDAKQQAAKNLSCTLFGKNAETTFRLYNDYVAQTITYLGRNLIKWVKDKANEKGYEAIYQDSVTEDTEIIFYDNKGVNFLNMKDFTKNLNFIKQNDKEICYIDNIKSLTINNNLKSEIKNIKKVIRHKTNKDIYDINCCNGYDIKVTSDHSLIILDDEANLKKVSAKELKKGDYIYTCNKIKRNKVISKNFKKEFYEFFGLWIADGHINKNDSISISSNDKEGHLLIKKISKIYDVNHHISKNNIDMNIGSLIFGRKMKELGFIGNSRTKRIPLWLFNETKENIYHFLRGMFSGDGSVAGKEILYSTINMLLAKDLQKLLKIVNIISTINISKTPNIYPDKKQNKIYGGKSFSKRVVIHKLSIKKYIDNIYFLIKRKNDKLRQFDNHMVCSKIVVPKDIIKYVYNLKWKQRKSIKNLTKRTLVNLLKDNNVKREDKLIIRKILNGDLCAIKVKGIKKLKKKERYVYDLEIDENHNFFGNQILIKNTDSCFLKLPSNLTKEKCIEKGKELANNINNQLGDFAKQFNVTEHTLGLDFEKLYGQFLLVAKKRYAGHIIWKDGKDDDAVQLVGLDAKRSDCSVISKSLQRHIINMILKGKGKEEVINYVKTVIEEIETKPYTEIALPVKFEKELDEYKTNIPRIRAAKWSNANLNTNYDAGQKVLMLYTIGDPDCICFEDDSQIENINIKIDYHKMIEKLVIMKIRRIFETIGWEKDLDKIVTANPNGNKLLTSFLK